MIRATTGGVLKSYRFNLMNSFIAQNKARDTVLSQRTFNSYAEDPAAAAKAFRLRKSRMTVESQYEICTDTTKKYDTAYSCLQSINEVLQTKDGQYGMYMKTLKGTTLSMLNDPEGDARTQLAKVMDEMSEMLVQTMNQKYGDNFIFAGADGHNVPFEVKTVDGQKQLFYRGVPVDAAVPNVVESGGANLRLDATTGQVVTAGNEASTDLYLLSDNIKTISADDYNAMTNDEAPKIARDSNGNAIKVNADGEQDPAGENFLVLEDGNTISAADYETQCKDAEKLKYLADEKYFVDIGLGFKEDANGNLIESSGFNAALNGINFLGYGLDEDGDPKNLYSLVQKMKEVSDSVPDGTDWSDSTWNEFDRLVGKFEKACSKFTTQFVDTDANTTKLQNQEKLLEDNFYNLQEQYAGLEDVDMVESIESFLWAEYAYNAALKVGNSVLGQSLMDYLS